MKSQRKTKICKKNTKTHYQNKTEEHGFYHSYFPLLESATHENTCSLFVNLVDRVWIPCKFYLLLKHPGVSLSRCWQYSTWRVYCQENFSKNFIHRKSSILARSNQKELCRCLWVFDFKTKNPQDDKTSWGFYLTMEGL